jgi:hypothetical protein
MVFSVYKHSLIDLAGYFSKKYSQVSDSELDTPNVVVQPTEPVIDKAIKVLKRMDPSYFRGVRRIQISPSSMYYGFVESGENKDPAVININMAKIKQESNSDDAVISAAITIAHERGHVTSYNESQGFVGGEAPAEQEERRVASWIEQNRALIQDLL